MTPPDLDYASPFLWLIDSPWLRTFAYLALLGIVGHRRAQGRTTLEGRLTSLEARLKPMEQIFIQSPWYTKTRLGFRPDRIVVHWIAGDLVAADRAFSPLSGRQVSAHYAVQDQTVHQYVEEKDTAWHAGNWWVNLKSIGVEHAGGPDYPVSDATYHASAELIAGICRRWGITPSEKTVIPHKAVIATQCPGTLDLPRLIVLVQEELNPPPLPEAPAVPAVQASAHPSQFAPFLTNLSPSQSFNAEAKRVQEFLVWKGYLEAPPESQWGYYGPKTQAAVDRFQKANGISAAPAYFGWWWTQTRAVANNQLTNAYAA